MKNVIEKLPNEFVLYNKIKDFNNYIRYYVANNIPSVHRDIRIHLLDECYNLNSLLFYSVYNKGNIRCKYLIDLRVKISLIDLLINDLKELKIIKNKTLVSAISKLATIKNIVYGWLLNEEDKRK